MPDLFLIRHGFTAWNLENRIQGQSDVPLSPEGIAQVRRWQLPQAARDATWFVSPLIRARETARLLGIEPAAIADELIEMDWGEWTGRRIIDLRAELGETMRENERRGLDFRPRGGESPRDVRSRFDRWVKRLPSGSGAIGAVTHKGTIRAAISLATGWDLKKDFEEKLRREVAHRFHFEHDRFELVALNIPLERKPATRA